MRLSFRYDESFTNPRLDVDKNKKAFAYDLRICLQETIMGPVCCKTDTKRLLLNSDAVNEFDSLSIFEINTTVDMININLGQKDFSTLNFIWLDSILKMLAFCSKLPFNCAQ